jgi:OmpA family protein
MVTNRATSANFLFSLLVAALIGIASNTAPAYGQGYPPGYYAPAPAYPPPCSAVNPGGGAVGTAARGAATGAIFGAIGGNAGRGAAVGAAVGGIAGAARRGSQRSTGYCY